jgi:predicted alpha/beta hydrolase family esterase
MKNAIILHGLCSQKKYYEPETPSNSNSHWLPWLQKQLMINDFKADTPEIPFVFNPKWENYVREVERFDITPNTTLVGHSMGGGFWVKYLSEHPEINVDKVILVAPWINSNHELDIDFFNFEINPNITKQANNFIVFYSDNDREDVQASIALLRSKLPDANFVAFHEYGHFTYDDMKTNIFPELLNVIVD